MKCQNLFFEKLNISVCCLLKILPRVLCIKQNSIFQVVQNLTKLLVKVMLDFCLEIWQIH